MKHLTIYSLILMVMVGCSTMNVASTNAEKMLGKGEEEIKMKMGLPTQTVQEGDYTVLIYAERIYNNLGQYGAIDKYQYTLLWIKNNVCTNWTVKEEVNPPDRVDYRAFVVNSYR